MKTNKHLIRVLAALCVLITNFTYAQVMPSDIILKRLRQSYNSISRPETSFESFVQDNRHIYESNTNAKSINPFINNLTLPVSCAKIRTFCSNGDFENGSFNNGLDTSQWLGAYGTWSLSSEPNPASLTDGFLAGPLTSAAARHSIVGTGVGLGIDPTTGISLPSPGGGTKALRLGNRAINFGTEIIGKTLTVTAAQTIFDFDYAVVFQDPNHDSLDQPWFSVRAFDCATGTELTGVCDLGNGSNRVISDASNPFFQDTVVSGLGSIAYRNWTRSQINLSAHIGKTVTIYFTNKDCALGGHFGYTYLDNFCSSGPPIPCPPNQPCPGFVTIDPSKSDTCGSGAICLKYGLPQAGTQIGNITINLDIYQNGVKVDSLTSGLRSQDSTYCFTINPGTLKLDSSLGGFDYIITGRRSIGTLVLPTIIIGNPPNGQKPGQNNDYIIVCGTTPPPPPPSPQCCPGTNLITNPGFEQGNTGFTSDYIYQSQIAAASVTPGYYTLANSAQALTISPTWDVNCASDNTHLLINGYPGMASVSKLAWKQDVQIDLSKNYQFCIKLKNLPQCGFDVKPKVVIRFLTNGISDSIVKVIDVPAGSCNWDLIQKNFDFPSSLTGTTNMTISIELDESGLGDGNDLAVDNISLIEISSVPISQLFFNISFNNITNNSFGILADPIAPLDSTCTSRWSVAEVNANYVVIPGTEVINPPVWAMKDPNDFNGYVGTSTLGDTSIAGIFQLNKRYRLVYSRSCPCFASSSFAAIIDPTAANGRAERIRFFSDPTQKLVPENSLSVTTSVNNSASKAEQKNSDRSFTIYPNPTKGNLTVAFGKASDKSKLIIYGVKGGVVKEVPLKTGDTRANINTSTLLPGTYIIKLYTDKNTDGETKVFVKQ